MGTYNLSRRGDLRWSAETLPRFSWNTCPMMKSEACGTVLPRQRPRSLHPCGNAIGSCVGESRSLKGKCEEAAHFLTIVPAGKVGRRRRLIRNGRNDRRTCFLCGGEAGGHPWTGLMRRCVLLKRCG